MKLVITGGLGFVGINMVRIFAEKMPQAEIIAADILPVTSGVKAYLKPVKANVSIVPLDIRERQSLLDLLAREKATHLIHAAAVTPSLQQEKENPGWIMDVNLGGAINALHAIQEQQGLQRLLLCSSNGVYKAFQPSQGETVPENSTLDLHNLYSITKHSSELLGMRTGELIQKPIASVRFASVYGPMERPTGARQNMSLMMRLKLALQENKEVRIFGPDITQDWVHTGDIAQALVKLLSAPKWSYPVYNLSSGKVIRLSELVAAYKKEGLQIRWVDDPGDANLVVNKDNNRGALDLSRLRSDIEYEPQYHPIHHLKEYLKEP